MSNSSAGLEATEAECAEGRTAPRVSLDDIKAAIAEEHYFTGADAVGRGGLSSALMGGPLSTLTICILVMQNGYTVLGTSAPASPENFDAALGKKLAYETAVRKVWPLMGYALRQKLHQDQQPG